MAKKYNLEQLWTLKIIKINSCFFSIGTQLDAVYDITVGYPKLLAETELDLLKGKFPSEIHFHVQRYAF